MKKHKFNYKIPSMTNGAYFDDSVKIEKKRFVPDNKNPWQELADERKHIEDLFEDAKNRLINQVRDVLYETESIALNVVAAGVPRSNVVIDKPFIEYGQLGSPISIVCNLSIYNY